MSFVQNSDSNKLFQTNDSKSIVQSFPMSNLIPNPNWIWWKVSPNQPKIILIFHIYLQMCHQCIFAHFILLLHIMLGTYFSISFYSNVSTSFCITTKKILRIQCMESTEHSITTDDKVWKISLISFWLRSTGCEMGPSTDEQ